MSVTVKTTAGEVVPTRDLDGYDLLSDLAVQGNLTNIVIDGATFQMFVLAEEYVHDITFKNCRFIDVNMLLVNRFTNVILDSCTIEGFDEWADRKDLQLINCKRNVPPTNEEIQKITGGKVYSLPNKNFVKVQVECAFCHNTFFDIMPRKRPYKMLKEVPQSDLRVCDQCYNNYDLDSKIEGHRHYGWSGPLSFYRTPMDAKDTEILGLEMEFEGTFHGWKGLQDAHRGHLHYGYDSSVRGKNELSWDCGSYSYWKYLAPLEDVCKAVADGGGEAGPTAGIHIHVSTPSTAVIVITQKINQMCSKGLFRVMMECVSLRTDRERFERYANLSIDASEHHAGISYNGHRTCEFRVFNSTLDPGLILRHLKFCKEFYHLVKTKTPTDKIMSSFSKETKRHIIACAKVQAASGFVSQENANKLIKALGV